MTTLFECDFCGKSNESCFIALIPFYDDKWHICKKCAVDFSIRVIKVLEKEAQK